MTNYEDEYSKKRIFSLEEIRRMTPAEKRKLGLDRWHYGEPCRGSYDEGKSNCQYTIGRDCWWLKCGELFLHIFLIVHVRPQKSILYNAYWKFIYAKGGDCMELAFLFVLFFVIVFAAILELVIRCPWAVTAAIAIIALVVYVFYYKTFGTIFIAWIVIYTLAAWLSAVLTCKIANLFKRNNCNRNDF